MFPGNNYTKVYTSRIKPIGLITLLLFMSACNYLNNKGELNLSSYKPEEIDYFMEVGFCHDNKTARWKDDIRIICHGDYQHEDIEFLDSLITVIDSLISPRKLFIVEKNGNVDMFFSEPPPECGGCEGLAKPKGSQTDNHIFAGKIWISPQLKGFKRKKTMVHECLHVLGLCHSYNKIFESFNFMTILNLKTMEAADSFYYKCILPDLDKKAVKILYSKELSFGISRDFFQERYLKTENR
jgi:hypothetical protein